MRQWKPTCLFASQLVTFAADDMLSCQARHSSDHARSQSELAQLGLHRMWERLSVIVGYWSRGKGKVNGGDLAHSRECWPRKRFEPPKGFWWEPRGEEKANVYSQALDIESFVSGGIEQDSKIPQKEWDKRLPTCMISDSAVVPRTSAITLTRPKKRRPVLSTADQTYVRSRKRMCVSSTRPFHSARISFK